VKTQIEKKSRGGREEFTIIHWLQDLQRFYVKVLALGFSCLNEKEGPFLTGGEGLFIFDLIYCMGADGRDPRNYTIYTC